MGGRVVRRYQLVLQLLHLSSEQTSTSRATVPTKVLPLLCVHISIYLTSISMCRSLDTSSHPEYLPLSGPMVSPLVPLDPILISESKALTGESCSLFYTPSPNFHTIFPSPNSHQKGKLISCHHVKHGAGLRTEVTFLTRTLVNLPHSLHSVGTHPQDCILS